jgi:hypothetical protein
VAIMEGFGTLAQLVEQRTFNPLVGGSSPPRPTKNKKRKSQVLPGFFAFVRLLNRPVRRYWRNRCQASFSPFRTRIGSSP